MHDTKTRRRPGWVLPILFALFSLSTLLWPLAPANAARLIGRASVVDGDTL